jgi:outer membrane protein OmpA-like peptidoglycan-associated protein
MRNPAQVFLCMTLGLALAACGGPSVDRPLGYEVDEGGFGTVTRTNSAINSGEIGATQVLAARFAAEVPNTVTFPFNSATLTPEAREVLALQARWIRQFPELRFSVYGHTDLVGSAGFNQHLGKRRAQAVVNFFASQGISRSRLDALVSFGKTRPVIETPDPEEANRRTVTEVSGFTRRPGAPMHGQYAAIIAREYLDSGTRPHPQNSIVVTQVDPGND